MLTLAQDILVLIATVTLAMLLTALLNRLWPPSRRYHPNDLVGWQLSVLGNTYAVILGFMLYTVWTSYCAADLNADLEANALRNLYRLADGLPEPQHQQLSAEVRSYADAVINQDWPDMARGHIPEQSHRWNEKMWQTLMSVKAGSTTEMTAEDHALTQLAALTGYRRTRLLESTSKLPAIFWCVLLVGGALTMSSVSMFGSQNLKLHAFQVFSVSLFVTLVMLAIGDVNRPFSGWVHISNYAFQRAQENMRAP